MCIATDPDGRRFGVWQSLGMPGAGIVNEPGGIAWEDARLTDVEAGRAFYTAVFGWSYGEIPGLDWRCTAHSAAVAIRWAVSAE